MQQLSRIILLASLACAAGSSCTHREDATGAPSSGGEVNTLAVDPEQCSPATFIEVVHRVNGVAQTDRLRVDDDEGADPALAMQSFRVAASYFGADSVVSSRVIQQVECFPQQAAARRPLTDPVGTGTLCVTSGGVVDCTPVVPTHTYAYDEINSCTVTDYANARSLSCGDSSAIVTQHGDVVLTVNTQNLRNEMLARTQALRALVGDANVITNVHFDIVITPDQQAAIVGNDAYNSIAQQIKQASDNGQPLPDIQQILHNLPQPPANIDFYTQLLQAYQTKLERLNLLSQITSGALLSPQQVNAFYQSFVQKSRLIDQLDVEHSASSLSQATGMINDTIQQLATTDPGSTVYNQVKAGAQSMLQEHTTQGVFDPDHALDVVVPNLSQSLTDPDLEKRLVASDMLVGFNEAYERGGGKERAAAMAGPLGLLAQALSNGDMDRVWRLYDQVQATEFFFDNTDPTGTSYDVHLTPEAQALFNIQAAPNSAVAYEVINLLNETADYNAATGQVTVDFRAVITINARQALSAADIKRALYHTEESYGILNFLKNAAPAFLGGALKELGSTASGIFYTAVALWSDPEAFFDHLKASIVNWRQTLDIILQQGVDVIDRWPNMTLEEKSELLGRIATQVLLTLPPEASEAGRLSEAVEEAVRLHLDKAARGLELIERGGVVLSEEAAVELVKQLERYEITATEDAISIADALDDGLPCSIVADVVGAIHVHAAGAKPPCSVTQIASVFDQFTVRAQKMGVTVKQEVLDLLASTRKVGPPGEIIDIGNKLSAAERAAGEKLTASKGGVLVGPVRENRPGIDGFYAGHPIQMKDYTGGSLTTAIQRISQAENDLKKAGFSDGTVLLTAEGFTRDQLISENLAAHAAGVTLDGTVSSIDILASGGEWIHIEGGQIF
jgi:hypothetical protein